LLSGNNIFSARLCKLTNFAYYTNFTNEIGGKNKAAPEDAALSYLAMKKY